MSKIEINIPAGASEVTLKTAGKYCDKDIKVTSFIRTEKGEFTPGENTLTFDLSGLSATPRFIEIANITATTEVKYTVYTTVGLIPITHAVWSGNITKNELTASVGHVEYYLRDDRETKPTYGKIIWGANLAAAKLKDGTITFTVKEGLPSMMFEEDVTYEWTAYYWDE